MNVLTDNDSEIPWFAETDFTGWLVQFKARLCITELQVVVDRPRPSVVDDDGDIIIIIFISSPAFGPSIGITLLY